MTVSLFSVQMKEERIQYNYRRAIIQMAFNGPALKAGLVAL